MGVEKGTFNKRPERAFQEINTISLASRYLGKKGVLMIFSRSVGGREDGGQFLFTKKYRGINRQCFRAGKKLPAFFAK